MKQSPSSNPESRYFSLQASWGLTKHMGGLEATRLLANTCHIGRDAYVLDVGCGVGITACYLAETYGCRVMGVDISEMMLHRSKERAKKKNVESSVKFKIADAADLPFADSVFDAVISESVVAFSTEKQRSINEFARVAKPGGYVAINEVTWIETPPPSLEKYLGKAFEGAVFLTREGWKDLFEKSGLSDLSAEAFQTNVWQQWISEMKLIHCGDILSAYRSFFSLLFNDPAAGKWLREIMYFPPSVFNIFKYFGYGIYSGRKNG